MTEDSNPTHVASQPVVVQEDTHQNEIPENIDSELYSTDSPTNSFHEFTIERGDELVEALRNNGYTVEFRDR
jgi:cell envelope opacity-associated protein A